MSNMSNRIDKKTPTEKPEITRFLSLVRVTDLKGDMLNYVDDVYHLNIYEVVAPGVLKLTHGAVNKNKRNVNMYFDVSGLSKTFHSIYAHQITEMEVTKIIDEPLKKVAYREGRIVTLLQVDEWYAELDKAIIAQLGYDYVKLISTPQGMNISPVLSTSDIKDDLYLRVNTEKLDEEVMNLIQEKMIEFVQQENKTYTPLIGDEDISKDFK